MGMYYEIEIQVPCPNCDTILDDFQSKDGEPLICAPLKFWQVNNFYTECPKCKLWVEYRLKPDFKRPTIKDYEGRCFKSASESEEE